MGREAKNIQSEVLLMVSRAEFNDGAKSTEVRVVDWIVDGKHYPQLEKREMYRDDSGEWKMGKAKGFSRKDLEKVQDAWGEIMAALGGTLPEQTARPGGAATAPVAAAAPAADIQQDF